MFFQFFTVSFRYLFCYLNSIALWLGREFSKAFAPPLTFVAADAIVIGTFIEVFASRAGGVHVFEELLPAVGVVGLGKSRPGAAGVFVQQSIFLAPSGDDVTCVTLKIIFLFLSISYCSRVFDPFSYKESRLGGKDTLGVVENRDHGLLELLHLLEIIVFVGVNVVNVKVAEVVSKKLTRGVDAWC